MKKALLSIMALVTLTACHGASTYILSDESLSEQSRHLTGFERIEQSGSIDVVYAQADTFSVKVEAPEKLLDKVETRVDGNKLVVNMKWEKSFVKIGIVNTKDIKIYVTSPDFLGIDLKGSGNFVCTSPLDTDNLDIDLKGSGNIQFGNIICDRARVSLIGSGDVSVSKMKALSTVIDLIGSGDIVMNFNHSGTVESRLKGSGDIVLTGSAKAIHKLVRGSGDIETSKLTITEK